MGYVISLVVSFNIGLEEMKLVFKRMKVNIMFLVIIVEVGIILLGKKVDISIILVCRIIKGIWVCFVFKYSCEWIKLRILDIVVIY